MDFSTTQYINFFILIVLIILVSVVVSRTKKLVDYDTYHKNDVVLKKDIVIVKLDKETTQPHTFSKRWIQPPGSAIVFVKAIPLDQILDTAYVNVWMNTESDHSGDQIVGFTDIGSTGNHTKIGEVFTLDLKDHAPTATKIARTLYVGVDIDEDMGAQDQYVAFEIEYETFMYSCFCHGLRGRCFFGNCDTWLGPDIITGQI
jgi:hypothetical protein